MINDEKEVSALRKQIIGLTACLAGLCFSGCRDVVLSTSLNDHILFSGTKTRLSLEECSLVFLDFQTRYNLYYENLGETDFWKEKAGEIDFSDYLRDGRIKEELCTLVLLNDMASGLGVTLTDEERSACRLLQPIIMEVCLMRRKAISSQTSQKQHSLYEKYRIAQKTIDELCSGINTEVSDNDKRVMILQLIAAPSYEEIEQAKERISSGEDFESVAKK